MSLSQSCWWPFATPAWEPSGLPGTDGMQDFQGSDQESARQTRMSCAPSWTHCPQKYWPRWEDKTWVFVILFESLDPAMPEASHALDLLVI